MEANYEMADKFFFIVIETRKCSNMSQRVAIQQKLRGNDEMGNLVCACVLFYFQMLNNILEYDIPKNILLTKDFS